VLATLIDAILKKRGETARERAVLVAVSGIDGAGKGWLAARLAPELRGLEVATVHADAWLNLPTKRFDAQRPAQNFYDHGFRFEELFRDLVVPLTQQRTHRVTFDFAEETAVAFTRRTLEFREVDVVLLEGILLFKRAHAVVYDLSVWVDCTYETALERALARAQEGLSREETVRAYETIYFPAQRIHEERDRPRERADLVFPNDARIG
jgi:uridine kinase